jgi:hypothetical protein
MAIAALASPRSMMRRILLAIGHRTDQVGVSRVHHRLRQRAALRRVRFVAKPYVLRGPVTLELSFKNYAPPNCSPNSPL